MKRKGCIYQRRKLGLVAMLLGFCLFLGMLVSCADYGKDVRKKISSVKDLKGAVIGVQLGTTSDILASELEKKGVTCKSVWIDILNLLSFRSL